MQVRRVLWIILFANLGVALLKIVVGTTIGSVSMIADGYHSLSDGSSNVVGLIGIRFASQPVDEDHPYGHRKFETLAGLFIAGMLFFVGGKIFFSAIDRFMNPVVPNITLSSLIVLLATLCTNIFVCVYEYNKGKALGSQILVSDSLHTKSDIYVSIGVLGALLGIKLGMPPVIDPIASLIVSGFIIYAAYGIFKDTSGVLVDRAAVDTNKIRDIALSFEQVKDTHSIRSRGCEPDLYIDMHIMTEPDMSVEKSHELIHSIEKQIQKELGKPVQVIVHLEPYDVV
ncbi:MAG: cation efflux rotein [Bacillota bacterium]|nr:MAG: cation efflux rotein [Bacillota bacterium]MBS3950949.1 cation transporter [Peptococcaceae bacterium]